MLFTTLLAAAALTAAARAADLITFPTPAPGKTTVGVQTADVPPDTLSFTVPLYVTVAAVDENGTPTVLCPDNYAIRNTTPSGADGTVYPSIAVTGLTVESAPGGTWSLKTPPGQGLELSMTIGGLPLPAVAAGDSTHQQADLTAAGSAFYDAATGRFNPILGGPTAVGLRLPIAGELPANFVVGEVAAAAQFKVKYTVSLLDEGGNPIGVVYDGPTEEDVRTPATPPVIPPITAP